MSTLTIVEGQGVGKQASGDIQAMAVPFTADVATVTFTTTAGYRTTATSTKTNVVYVYTDAACSILPSAAASAAVTSVNGFPMVASTGQYFSTNGAPIYFSVVAKG